ncbi:DUF2304 domain-containing protein [Priestia abyssalis]|uniref:DUF2304 domain-containing protein n=1 Tax=Priestia abyssalis TaxID=1221450 RepID=UPI00147608AB|nr:DUF2304 domain-containing protein [Priestia abyssalis]
MNLKLEAFLLLCGVLSFMMILYLLVRRKITEKYSVVWLLGGGCVLLLSGNPDMLDHMARRVGIDYPPSLLFLLSILVIWVYNLHQSMEMTKLNKKIKDLAQHMAFYDHEGKEPSAPHNPCPQADKERNLSDDDG